MVTIIGIDAQLTRLAAVSYIDNKFCIYAKPRMPTNMYDRVKQSFFWLQDILIHELEKNELGVAIYIESPFSNVGRFGNLKVGLQLSEIHGALKAASISYDSLIVESVHNKTWKSKVIGGTVDKTAIAKYIQVYYHNIFSEAQHHPKSIRQDIYDATCIAIYGEAHYRQFGCNSGFAKK